MKQQKVDSGMKLENSLFNLEEMNEDEVRAMFMNVSVKSLDNWLAYYKEKGQYELCQLIKDIKTFRNAGV